MGEQQQAQNTRVIRSFPIIVLVALLLFVPNAQARKLMRQEGLVGALIHPLPDWAAVAIGNL